MVTPSRPAPDRPKSKSFEGRRAQEYPKTSTPRGKAESRPTFKSASFPSSFYHPIKFFKKQYIGSDKKAPRRSAPPARPHSNPVDVPNRRSSYGGNSSAYQDREHHSLSNGRSSAFPILSSSFAGSKCYEPPSPSSLPKPPLSWCTQSMTETFVFDEGCDEAEITRHLKLLLKVQ